MDRKTFGEILYWYPGPWAYVRVIDESVQPLHLPHDCHLVDTWYTTDLSNLLNFLIWHHFLTLSSIHLQMVAFFCSISASAFSFLSFSKAWQYQKWRLQLAWGEMGLLQHGPTSCMGNIHWPDKSYASWVVLLHNPFPLESFCQPDSGQSPPRKSFLVY